MFRSHYRSLLRLGVVLTGDPALAEELAQEAFVRYHGSPARPRRGAELAYLRRTVVNLSHVHHRRTSFLSRIRNDNPAPATPEQLAITSERQSTVMAAVRKLPSRQRDCVVLFYFMDLGTREIATTLGLSPGSVKTHLHRARATLGVDLKGLR